MRRRTQLLASLAIALVVLQGPASRSGTAAGQDFTQLLYCAAWGCGMRFFITEEVTAVASYGELHVWDGGRWGYAACSDCMRMVDEPPPHPEPVDGGGEGPVPTSLNNYGQGNLSGTPAGCQAAARYWKFRDYQVLDQSSQAIQRVMPVDESFTTSQNTCGVGFIEGDGYTTSVGTFRDNFFMCGSVPACDNGGSCTAVRNQSWKADNSPVGQYTITYSCAGVTITP